MNALILELTQDAHTMRRMNVLQAPTCDSVGAPMTWGHWHAALLLPADVGTWPHERLRVVLLHELAHVRRGDWLTQTLGQALLCLYWYHPLVWLAYRRMHVEAEMACDDAVLLAGIHNAAYASHLLDVLKRINVNRERLPVTVAMARVSHIGNRMQRILDARLPRRMSRLSFLAVTTVTAALLIVTAAFLRPVLPTNAAHAQTGDVVVTAVRRAAVTLPNGATVELAGVAARQYSDNWWSPDGKPLHEAPRFTEDRFHNIHSGLGTQYLARSLWFRLTSPADAEASTTGYVVDPARSLQTDGYHYGRDLRLEDTRLKAGKTAVGTVDLGFPHNQTRFTYRFGIATGPWQTVAVTKLNSHPTRDMILPARPGYNHGPILWLYDRPNIIWTDRIGRPHVQYLLGGNRALGDVARRVVALDQAGQEVLLDAGDYDYRGERGINIPVETLVRIAAIRLETRPYQWAEFRDIILEEPRTFEQTVAMPPALPGYQHTYSCGLTITLPAITESRADGGHWWRPDGSLLAAPIKGYDKEVQLSGWPGNEHPRAFLLQQAATHPINFSVAMQFIPESHPGTKYLNFEYQVNPAAGSLLAGTMNESFPPDTAKCTLRYGVAAGPWQTVATLPLPQHVKRTDARPESFDADVDLYLKDQPGLTYTDQNGKLNTLDFLPASRRLGRVARRFIAIDQDGKEVKLTVALSGRDFDVIPLVYRETGIVHQYNPIDLSRIREFRLQTRPFEWAEFRNIALKPKPQLAQR